MPIYEYRCKKGHTTEVMQRMSDDPVTACATCEAPVQRVFHPVAVHFKGSGFYNTDYGKKRRGGNSDSSEGGSSSSEGGSSSSEGGSSSTEGGAKSDSGKSESGSSGSDKAASGSKSDSSSSSSSSSSSD